MTLETRLRNTGFPPGGGGGSSNSSGLAGTGLYYIVGSSETTLPRSKVLAAGANISISTDATTFTISANTGGASNSAGLLGTGLFFILHTSGNSTAPFSKLIAAGSSVTTHTDSTSFYINAITNASAASGGLAGTGFYYLVGSNAAGLPFSKVVTAGSSVTIHTSSTAFFINAITNASAASGGLAGTGFYYIVGSSSPGLPFSKIITAGSSVTTHTDATSIYINATTSAGGGSGTVNAGSANYLAYYPVSGTTIDDAPISVSTGADIAPFNVAILTTTASSAANGDFWFQTSSGRIYLACRSASVNYFVAMNS